MSDVNAHDFTLIRGPDDVLPLYAGSGTASMVGIESELAYFDPTSPNLSPMSIAQNLQMPAMAQKFVAGDWVRQEPSSEMIELNSDPQPYHNLEAILEDTRTKTQALCKSAHQLGLKRSFFQDLPHITSDELLKNIVPLERYQAFFNPPRADMRGIASYFTVSKSNQVSVSYRDTDHMLENVRRLYFLAPFLFLLTDNGSGFAEGTRLDALHGLHYRSYLGKRGGVPDYLFTAQNGKEYIHAHLNAVLHNPLYVYYDKNGTLQRLPSGTWSSFSALASQGLNTASNFYLAQSVLWPDVKIATLKTPNGEIYGHRYEARMFGVGIHQHQTALMIVAGMAFDSELAEAIDQLLRKYGFDSGDLTQTKTYVTAAYSAAHHHNGKFFDIPFGNGNMASFAKEFANAIEMAPTLQGPRHKLLLPLLTICRSGFTDGKVNHLLFSDLEAINDWQRNFDTALFADSNQCAYSLFQHKIQSQAA